jgi:hypothetical protein
MKRKALAIIIGILAVVAIITAGCSASPTSAPAITSAQAVPTSTSSGSVVAPVTSQVPVGTSPSSTAYSPVPVAATGNVEVRVTDAPARPNVTAVLVTVSSVEIHLAGGSASPTPTVTATTTTNATSTPPENSGWITMKLSGPSTFDLLKVKGLEQVLATSDLAPGTYTQVTMDVTKVEVTIDGKTQDAKLPSGTLKFVQPFDVTAGKTTVLVFDFDAANSVNVTGNGQVIFKPVIKLNVTKTPGKMQITTSSLPNGEVGVAYNSALTAIGGTLPLTWSISSGNLPPGLTLTAGVVAGPPTTAGDSVFTVKVEDSSTPVKKDDAKSFTINIAAAGILQFLTTALPDGNKNAPYTVTLQAVGGTGSYQWSLNGSLPTGLSLNPATGEISGTPTTNGDFKITVKVIDSASPANTDTQNLTFHVAEDASAA